MFVHLLKIKLNTMNKPCYINHYKHIRRIIRSCKTEEQLDSCRRMANNFYDMWTGFYGRDYFYKLMFKAISLREGGILWNELDMNCYKTEIN